MGEHIPPTALCPPFIAVDGVPNCRVIGGYPCSAPHTISNPSVKSWSIRPDFLFRAAQPAQITPSGVKTLTGALQISAVFDFRSAEEIQLVQSRYPDSSLEIPGTTRYAVPIFNAKVHSPGSLATRYGATSGDAPERGFVKAYEEIARQGARTESFRTIMMKILHHPNDPILFHCTVGKDRTGVFAALLLKLCGVADEDVVADYALTTQGLGAWREHLIQRLLQRGEVATREEAEYIVGSQAVVMRAFLQDVVEVQFGGARKYFVDLCGLQEEELDKIIQILVIPQ